MNIPEIIPSPKKTQDSFMLFNTDLLRSFSALIWDRFIGGLKQRGLEGVRLFTSDAHPGIHPAIKKHYPGAVWQRCQRHYSVNALNLVPKLSLIHI